MRPNLFHTRAGSPSARLATAAALTLVACALALLLGEATADATLSQKRDRLERVQAQQATVSDQIAAGNQQINALIGQVADLRRQERAAAQELAQTEADLEAATAELAQGREHLRQVRNRLHRAVAELKRILVGVYKSDDPEMIKLLLESSGWEDASVDATYLERVHQYQADTIARVKDLRAEAESAVEELQATKQRIEEQRDAIAARRQELADTQASLQAREQDLAAARDARRQTLSRLAGQEVQLQDDIEAEQRSRREERAAAIPPPAPEPADDSNVAAPQPEAPAPSGSTATLNPDGSATAPADAPPQVKAVIAAANQIRDMPYVWGGGHGSFNDSGYDCSGAVSYALHGGGFLSSPLDSTGLSYWGESGAGNWITVYANSGHAYAVIAGLRWDTSGTGGSGPSWSTTTTSYMSPSSFTARHPAGF